MKSLEEKLKLEIIRFDCGCGLNVMKPVDDWIHMDISPSEHIDIVGDFFEGIPLPDNFVDEFHASEVIEHIPLFLRDKTLKEWNRVMKMGCNFWGTCPNLDHVIKATYLKKQPPDWTIKNLYGDQNGYPNQHYHLYTSETLKETLGQYGLTDVEFTPVGGDEPEDWWWLRFKATKTKNV